MGFATVAGGSRATAPSAGILASDIAVGSMVKLMESGSAVEYRVVHQGLPSSLYDASCNGCWLLREYCSTGVTWNSPSNNSYKNSNIDYYAQNSHLALFDSDTQAIIKDVKIPYFNGTGSAGSVASGADGLPRKVFSLGCYELGFGSDDSYAPVDGAQLSYFDSQDKRVAMYSSTTHTAWWTRSPYTRADSKAWLISESGNRNGYNTTNYYAFRPALILPSNALFDTDTMILKGVA